MLDHIILYWLLLQHSRLLKLIVIVRPCCRHASHGGVYKAERTGSNIVRYDWCPKYCRVVHMQTSCWSQVVRVRAMEPDAIESCSQNRECEARCLCARFILFDREWHSLAIVLRWWTPRLEAPVRRSFRGLDRARIDIVAILCSLSAT